MIKITTAAEETREVITEWKRQGLSVGFVPTMGFLHEGHKSLIDKAAKDNDRVAVSVFVNPMQFSPNEDLDKYPRDFAADTKLCEESGADLIFHPTPEELYPDGFCSFVDMTGPTAELCGKSRPIHFRGVCTVVNKLFNIIQPDRAYFGQKDAQQLAVIRRMVKDLNMPVEVIGCPIIREADGLAKSSRNKYLSEDERKAALILSKTIFMGEKMLKNGEKSISALLEAMRKNIEAEPLAKIDYVDAVDADSIRKIDAVQGRVLVAIAVYIGKTRLIDNFIFEA
ncbi:MAG: pantoate--beta-alanine ligase [Clostridiales bacterium]|nr:pantoate--beta-alanine ligase [Clostridiales bacterium]